MGPSLPKEALSTGPRLAALGRWPLAAGCLLLALASGCVNLKSFLADTKDAPPTGPVCQVLTVWNNHVVFGPDPTRGGAPTPALVGRMYLYGPNIDCSLAGDGSAVVELFDLSPGSVGGNKMPLEVWQLTKDMLQGLMRRDTVGWGYTLPLPWGTYRPDVTHVQLKVCYTPAGGAPIYAYSSPMSLNPTSDMRVSSAARPLISPVLANWSQSPRPDPAPVPTGNAAVQPVAGQPERTGG